MFGSGAFWSGFDDGQELPDGLDYGRVFGNVAEHHQIAADVLMENLAEVQNIDL